MWLLTHAVDIFNLISNVVAVGAAVAAVTPTPKDDSIFSTARKVVDFVGFNFGYAKNK